MKDFVFHHDVVASISSISNLYQLENTMDLEYEMWENIEKHLSPNLFEVFDPLSDEMHDVNDFEKGLCM